MYHKYGTGQDCRLCYHDGQARAFRRNFLAGWLEVLASALALFNKRLGDHYSKLPGG
jgi:hypothetical protein